MRARVEQVTIVEDRYAGTYIRLHLGREGRFTAWHSAADGVPTAPSGDDSTASAFWAWVRTTGYIVGVGRSRDEAVADLTAQIEGNAAFDDQPTHLADWLP